MMSQYEEFKNLIPKRKVSTPMPSGTFLSMYNPDGTKREQPDELTADIKKKGYMTIVCGLARKHLVVIYIK